MQKELDNSAKRSRQYQSQVSTRHFSLALDGCRAGVDQLHDFAVVVVRCHWGWPIYYSESDVDFKSGVHCLSAC